MDKLEAAEFVGSFLPVIGTGIAAKDFVQALRNGDREDMALAGGLLALGALPGGAALGKAIKLGSKGAKVAKGASKGASLEKLMADALRERNAADEILGELRTVDKSVGRAIDYGYDAAKMKPTYSGPARYGERAPPKPVRDPRSEYEANMMLSGQ